MVSLMVVGLKCPVRESPSRVILRLSFSDFLICFIKVGRPEYSTNTPITVCVRRISSHSADRKSVNIECHEQDPDLRTNCISIIEGHVRAETFIR